MKRFLFCTLTLVLMLLALASCFGENHDYTAPCDPSCNECNRVTREPEAEHTFQSCSDTECDACGEKREPIDHTYTSDCDLVCDVCGEKRTSASAHTYTGICDADCNACGETRVAADHIYSNDCDTDCNFCGELRTTNHVYANACAKACKVCGELRIPGAHTYSNACDTTCDICGALRMASNHVYATACDADCNVCGELRISEPHTYDHSCDADCNVCGAVRTVSEHVYDDACDEICDNCGTKRENVHSFGEWSVKTAATCDAPAVEARSCALCGTAQTRDAGEALGHVYDNDCDVACNRAKCDYTRAITHVYKTEFTTKIAASCTGAEMLHRFCDICGAEEVQIGKAALGHTYDDDCDAECNREDCDFVRVIGEEDHDFSDWTTATPADCLNPEIESRTCGTCGGTETREGDKALGHDFENDCDPECNRCGHTRQITHDFDEWTTLKPATCTEAEIEEQICGVCGAHNPETRVGDAPLDHTYTNECDAVCDRDNCGFERTPPHRYADEHDVTCENGCGHVRPCNGHKALETNCLVCEYCSQPIPNSTHSYVYICDTTCSVCGLTREDAAAHSPDIANGDCTVCQYCSEKIEGAKHVATTDCTKCGTCGATIEGATHTPDYEHNCTVCTECGKASGVDHTPDETDCTDCGVCGQSRGTAHTDSNSDSKCDDCEQETLPGENWFPWAPL